MLQGLLRRNNMGDPNHYAQNAIITTMVHVLLNATNATKLAIFARDCRSTTNANNANHQSDIGLGQKPTCFEYGVQGHFKRECPKLKNNNNHGNQVGGGNAPAKVYAVGHAGTNPDSNVVTVFLAHITTKEVEDKLEKKRLEDIPIVQDFPEVFPKDLPGLPQTRQVDAFELCRNGIFNKIA
ncbi:putative reverse transcriptase domain-containing protein [Tanacetum coccineum]|uniref:Reverse transcriptase domain-containing protein n=1 Tax=Tanacetum coccineum TaxID=301880 RepID=A0ABQ4WSI3_9ASTR